MQGVQGKNTHIGRTCSYREHAYAGHARKEYERAGHARKVHVHIRTRTLCMQRFAIHGDCLAAWRVKFRHLSAACLPATPTHTEHTCYSSMALTLHPLLLPISQPNTHTPTH
jgi:hypothetical protein